MYGLWILIFFFLLQSDDRGKLDAFLPYGYFILVSRAKNSYRASKKEKKKKKNILFMKKFNIKSRLIPINCIIINN